MTTRYINAARREMQSVYEVSVALRNSIDKKFSEHDTEEIFFMLDDLQSRVSRTRNYYAAHVNTKSGE